jgi:serine protease inhibitor
MTNLSYVRSMCTAHPLFMLLLAAGVLVMPGCDGVLDPADRDPQAPITELPRELSGAELAAIRASNAFTFDLLREISREEPDSTVFLSGFSASMALGMTMNGAAGETFEAMRSTLRFHELAQPEINAAYRDLLELLRTLDPSVTLEVGNAVWHRDGLVPRTTFREAVEAHFGARVQGLDWRDDASADTINAWVTDATRGRIDRVVDAPLQPDHLVYLMNAVYFDAHWREQFDPDSTVADTFHLRDGTTETVEFMVAPVAPRRFAFEENYSAVDLPYGGGAFSMTVVVPRGEVTLDELVQGLDLDGWNALVSELADQSGGVWLPRFEVEWGASLLSPLQALGMERALSESANFTSMFEGPSNLMLTQVTQKTWVRVDEEGTEAAAVTIVGGGVVSVQAPPTVRADRPFLLAIRERISGTILFVGAVVEPPLM